MRLCFLLLLFCDFSLSRRSVDDFNRYKAETTAKPKQTNNGDLIGKFQAVRSSVLLIYAKCNTGKFLTSFSEQISYGYFVNRTHNYAIAGAFTPNVKICKKSVPGYLFQLCKNNKCSGHGKCEIINQDSPIAREQCICEYGYNGMFCERKIPSRMYLLASFWIIVSIEAFFILLAIFRHSRKKFYEPPYRAERFVDVLKVATKQEKKLRKML